MELVHVVDREALALRVVEGIACLAPKLSALAEDIRQLWVEFEALKPGETIMGCATKKQFCDLIGRTPRAVRYMLAGGNVNRGETISPLRLEKLPVGVTVLMDGDDPKVRERHARQLLRLNNLMNPDPDAPEYNGNLSMKMRIACARQCAAAGRKHNGALDAVTYFQDRLAWKLIIHGISVRDLERRIDEYEKRKCTECLFVEPGYCWHCYPEAAEAALKRAFHGQ